MIATVKLCAAAVVYMLLIKRTRVSKHGRVELKLAKITVKNFYRRHLQALVSGNSRVNVCLRHVVEEHILEKNKVKFYFNLSDFKNRCANSIVDLAKDY